MSGSRRRTLRAPRAAARRRHGGGVVGGRKARTRGWPGDAAGVSAAWHGAVGIAPHGGRRRALAATPPRARAPVELRLMGAGGSVVGGPPAHPRARVRVPRAIRLLYY